jgi:hypothetical protein
MSRSAGRSHPQPGSYSKLVPESCHPRRASKGRQRASVTVALGSESGSTGQFVGNWPTAVTRPIKIHAGEPTVVVCGRLVVDTRRISAFVTATGCVP